MKLVIRVLVVVLLIAAGFTHCKSTEYKQIKVPTVKVNIMDDEEYVAHFVEFCPKAKLEGYPTSIPTKGMCIHHVLYLMYWDEDRVNGWLEAMTPGDYPASETGLTCDFKLLPNCEVK